MEFKKLKKEIQKKIIDKTIKNVKYISKEKISKIEAIEMQNIYDFNCDGTIKKIILK